MDRRPVAAGLLALAAGLLVLVLDLKVAGAVDRTPAGPADRAAAAHATSAVPEQVEVAQSKGVVSTKMLRYAQRLIRQYDRDGDGRLDASEWAAMRGDPRRADLDGDGFVTTAELAQRVADYGWHRAFRLATSGGQSDEPDSTSPANQPPDDRDGPDTRAVQQSGGAAARRSLKYFVPAANVQGLPAWFVQLDTDGDGQLTLAEFAPQGTKARVAEFAQYDLDGDGVITPQEYLRAIKNKPPVDAEPSAKR